MKCPRCGSGKTHGTGGTLGKQGWLRRFFCDECKHTWVDEVGPRPPEKDEEK